MSKLEKLSTNMKESGRWKELRAKKKNTVKTPDPVGSPAAYATDSCLIRAVKRVGKHLPKSPGKKRGIDKELACKVKLSFKKTKTMLAKHLAAEVWQKVIDYYNRK